MATEKIETGVNQRFFAGWSWGRAWGLAVVLVVRGGGVPGAAGRDSVACCDGRICCAGGSGSTGGNCGAGRVRAAGGACGSSSNCRAEAVICASADFVVDDEGQLLPRCRAQDVARHIEVAGGRGRLAGARDACFDDHLVELRQLS